MFELYLDCVDVQQISRFNNCLPLRGVTSNPSILAASGLGLRQLLPALTAVLGNDARFHVQVVSRTLQEMLEEARQLHALPYDIVVKVPADETGLAAIKIMKAEGLCVLATAIYSVQQGFLAALCGADYLAPYVNRIDNMGADGIGIVADLQLLIERHGLAGTLLPASFKNTRQALEVMKLGVGAITLPLDVAAQMLVHPATEPAVQQFTRDWQKAFPGKLSCEV